MIPLYHPTEAQTVLGLPCAQNALALPTWEYAFKVHPPRRILEIGCGTGAFTYALKQVVGPDVTVTAWDITKAPTEGFEKRFALHPYFHHADAMSAYERERISVLLGNEGTSYVLCDGGNKLEEFKTFAPMLKPGDVIAVHDYMVDRRYWGWVEIDLKSAMPVADKMGLELFLYHELSCAAWLAFKKV